MVIFIFAYVMMAAVAITVLITKHRFDSRRDTIKQRILVLGSDDLTVGAEIAVMLRKAAIRTFSRTASACRLTLPDGQEARIERPKLLHMPDWSRLLRSFAVRRADAVVYSQSSVGKGLRGRLELLFFRPTIIVIAGQSEQWSRNMPADATIIQQTDSLPAWTAVARHLGLQDASSEPMLQPPTAAEPTLTYTTRTRVRQRLHAIIDKLDKADSAA